MTELMINLGSPAPDFVAMTTQGHSFRLSEQRGKIVVLYFFPKAFTPGCTAQTSQFRDAYPELKAMGVEVVGISADDDKVQCDFASSIRVEFPMIGDSERKIIDAYDASWPIFRLAQRVTYVVDGEGILRHCFHHELRISHHKREVLAAVMQLSRKQSEV
jgi:peroxiredoxin